jgi:hypothetical protein
MHLNKEWMRKHWVELAALGVSVLGLLYLWLKSRGSSSSTVPTVMSSPSAGTASGSGGGSGAAPFDPSGLQSSIDQLSAQQAATIQAMGQQSNQNAASQASLASELQQIQSAMAGQQSSFAAALAAQGQQDAAALGAGLQQNQAGYASQLSALEQSWQQQSASQASSLSAWEASQQQAASQAAATLAQSQSAPAASALTGVPTVNPTAYGLPQINTGINYGPGITSAADQLAANAALLAQQIPAPPPPPQFTATLPGSYYNTIFPTLSPGVPAPPIPNPYGASFGLPQTIINPPTATGQTGGTGVWPSSPPNPFATADAIAQAGTPGVQAATGVPRNLAQPV